MKENLIDTPPTEIVKELRLVDRAGRRVSFQAFIPHVKECAADGIFNKSEPGHGVHVAVESFECILCCCSDADFEMQRSTLW